VQTSTDVNDQSAVLWPDGSVSSAEDLTCANISAYLAIMKERAEEKKKAAAE